MNNNNGEGKMSGRSDANSSRAGAVQVTPGWEARTGGYLLLLLAGLAERRESERRPRAGRCCMQRVARQWKAQNGLTPQAEAQQIKRVTFFREGRRQVEVGRVGDIPDGGMGCSTQTIRSSSFERLA